MSQVKLHKVAWESGCQCSEAVAQVCRLVTVGCVCGVFLVHSVMLCCSPFSMAPQRVSDLCALDRHMTSHLILQKIAV